MIISKINKYAFLLTSLLVLVVFLDCSVVFARETLWQRLKGRWLKKKNQIRANPGSDDYQYSLEHDGIIRKYNLHLPSGYDKNSPTPVVIYLHGGGGSIRAAYEDGIDKASDEFGFILAIPAGTGPIPDRLLRWNGGTWDGAGSRGYAVDNNIDDVGFISKLIDEVIKEFSVDENRIYATGISNGALMTYRLGCELSDKIAAIAVVAAPAMPSNYVPSRPISVMLLHGTADPVAPFYGGKGGIRNVSFQAHSAKDMVDYWVEKNACPKDFTTSYENGRVKCLSYGPCRNSTVIEFCTIEGGGHTWPSGWQYSPVDRIGPVSYDISFEQIWEFFKKHPRK